MNQGKLRNPTDEDREILERLANLESFFKDDHTTLKTLLRIIKGDQEINGIGLLQRMKDLEALVEALEDSVDSLESLLKEMGKSVELLEGKFREIVKEEVAKINGLRPGVIKDFKNLPNYQKIIVIGTILAFFSLNVISILHSVLDWLQQFVK